VQFFRGELGQPSGGFPPDLQQKICKGQALLTERPGSSIPDADLEALRAEAEEKARRKISDEEFASYLMYPKVFLEYALRAVRYGPVTILPTPVFFYGMAHGEEIAIDLEPGKTLIIQYVAIGEDNDSTFVKVFFELNGQPRTIRVENQKISYQKNQRTRADLTNANHVASPMPGQIVSISVKAGQDIQSGDLLLTIAAMKMDMSIHAEREKNYFLACFSFSYTTSAHCANFIALHIPQEDPWLQPEIHYRQPT
jgi:pyruvate carboxylase